MTSGFLQLESTIPVFKFPSNEGTNRIWKEILKIEK
jgi:hypothetical protein